MFEETGGESKTGFAAEWLYITGTS